MEFALFDAPYYYVINRPLPSYGYFLFRLFLPFSFWLNFNENQRLNKWMVAFSFLGRECGLPLKLRKQAYKATFCFGLVLCEQQNLSAKTCPFVHSLLNHPSHRVEWKFLIHVVIILKHCVFTCGCNWGGAKCIVILRAWIVLEILVSNS